MKFVRVNICGATAAPAARSVRVPYEQPLQGPHGLCIALLVGWGVIHSESLFFFGCQEFYEEL